MRERLDERTASRIRRFIAMLTMTVGLGAVLFGGYWLERQHDFLATAAIAEGRVIANRREDWNSRSGSSRHSYRAIVTFTDRAGQRITYPDFFAFSPPSFSVGQTVRVFYDPHSPQHAWIDRGDKEKYLLIGICAFGTLLLFSAARALSEGRRYPTLSR